MRKGEALLWHAIADAVDELFEKHPELFHEELPGGKECIDIMTTCAYEEFSKYNMKEDRNAN